MQDLSGRRNTGISQKILSKIGSAVREFNMITSGDRITVGLSGGKDSVLLLAALADMKQKSPVDFSLDACLVDITDGMTDTSPMKTLCERLGVALDIVPYPVLDIIRSRNEKSPCSLCANLRGGLLFSRASEKGATVVAMGHNLDDAVETVLLNLFYAGKFRCFTPNSWRSRTKLRLIRPLVFLPERSVVEEISRLGEETISPMCPFSDESHRSRIKDLIITLEKEIPDVRSQVLHALRETRLEDTWRS